MGNFLSKNMLLFVVFITGAAVLILEVTATRILATYFGSTIFTVSSVISVILLALSLGYYFGGRLADKKGTPTLFYAIIATSGVSVFVLQFLNAFIAPVISRSYSLQNGPLIVSLLLFFLPAFLLGTLSPLVVTLQKKRSTDGVGKTAGDVFFWSTLGSILGSLSTGFYLIPTFGINQIIMGVASTLVIIGLVGLSFSSKDSLSRIRFLVIIPFVLLAQVSFLYVQQYFLNFKTIYEKDGVYGSIVIFDDKFAGKPARFLRQDADASSAMFLDSSDLVYKYTKYYVLYKAVHPSIKQALVIGAGAYSVPKALLENESEVHIDVVDIEPYLLRLGQTYFDVPKTKRLTNHVEDGRRFLSDNDKQYDLIFSDAFHFSIPAHLTTQEFFLLTKERLAPEGMFVMNIIGSLSSGTPSFALSEMRTFQSVYQNSYFFGASDPYSSDIQNIIMVGYNSDKKLDLSQTSFADKRINTRELALEKYPLFTDNYAPVEYYISKNFAERN